MRADRYSGPSCFSRRDCSVAISCAVYSETRGLASSKGLTIVVCWSPGLQRREGRYVSQLEISIMEDACGLRGALRRPEADVADEYLRRHFGELSSSMHPRQMINLGLVVVENGMA